MVDNSMKRSSKHLSFSASLVALEYRVVADREGQGHQVKPEDVPRASILLLLIGQALNMGQRVEKAVQAPTHPVNVLEVRMKWQSGNEY